MPGILAGVALLLMHTANASDSPIRNDGMTTISLNAVPGLQYDQARFRVKPGARVRIMLTNKDDMSHNLVITKSGKRSEVVSAAMKLGESGPAMDYIPQSPDVLWSIRVIAPGESASVTFTAPKEKGVYPYVCTFPGHGFSMYGAMYVTDEEDLPPLSEDGNIPESRRDDEKGVQPAHAGHHAPRAHPYQPEPPFMYRAYMPDSGPASIAVHLADQLSYCWDAEVCELRYAWEGGFLDNTAFWKGKPNAEPKILGTVLYRNRIDQPLRLVKNKILAVDFRGYRLADRHPEFHYRLNGIDVYELVHADGDGLIRTFRIPAATDDVWFVTDPRDGMKYESSAGTWQDGTLRVPAAEAGKFSIVMKKRGGVQ